MAKNHRTCLIIDASSGFTGEYKERVERLLQSLNGPNIKTDIYHTTDGVNLVEGQPSAVAAAPVTASAEAAAKALGYAQVLVSKPGK